MSDFEWSLGFEDGYEEGFADGLDCGVKKKKLGADVSASGRLLHSPAGTSPEGAPPTGAYGAKLPSQTTTREWVVELMGGVDPETGVEPDYDCTFCRADAYLEKYGYSQAEGVVSLGVIGGIRVVIAPESHLDTGEWEVLGELKANDGVVLAYALADTPDEEWLEERMELAMQELWQDLGLGDDEEDGPSPQ